MLRAFARLPRFTKEFRQFQRQCRKRVTALPCLHDWRQEGGSAKNEYFWQDLYFARKVYVANPQKHVDIGSRIDGFVAHVASFRQIEVFDIRPITVSVPGVVFRQADFMKPLEELKEYCDSLSCLHALEHFGLGRYGDSLEAQGHESGLRNMAHILQPGGKFYLSVPLGRERVEFNAHRIFSPRCVVKLATANNLYLRDFAFFQANGMFKEANVSENLFDSISQRDYTLGLFTFEKRVDNDSTY